jgi:hypothetical protein
MIDYSQLAERKDMAEILLITQALNDLDEDYDRLEQLPAKVVWHAITFNQHKEDLLIADLIRLWPEDA